MEQDEGYFELKGKKGQGEGRNSRREDIVAPNNKEYENMPTESGRDKENDTTEIIRESQEKMLKGLRRNIDQTIIRKLFHF